MAALTLLEARRRAFIVHLILFLLVMGGLAALNLSFTPNTIWFVYPLIGWGIGVVLHYLFAVIWARGSLAEAKTDWKSQGLMRAFVIHLVVYLAVNGILLFINLTYSPQMLWVLFPAVGWGIGVALHLALTLLWAPRPE